MTLISFYDTLVDGSIVHTITVLPALTPLSSGLARHLFCPWNVSGSNVSPPRRAFERQHKCIHRAPFLFDHQ